MPMWIPRARRYVAGRRFAFIIAGAAVVTMPGPARAGGGGDSSTTDETAFLQSLQPGYYYESFDELTQAIYSEPLSFSDGAPGGFAYSVTTDTGNGIYVAPADETLPNDLAISPADEAATEMVFTFTGAPVTAIGGDFFETDLSGLAQPGSVTLTLSDGTTYTVTSTDTDLQAFFGVTTPAPIVWASVTNDDVGFYPTIDNLTVGSATPEPGTLALVGLTGTLPLFGSAARMLRRRRR